MAACVACGSLESGGTSVKASRSECAQRSRQIHVLPDKGEPATSQTTRLLQTCLVDARDAQLAPCSRTAQRQRTQCEVDEADPMDDDLKKNGDVFAVTVHFFSGESLLVPDLRKNALVEDLLVKLYALRPLGRGEAYRLVQGDSVVSEDRLVQGECFNAIVRNCLGLPRMREHCGDDPRTPPKVTFAEEEVAFVEPPAAIDSGLQAAIGRGLRSSRSRQPTAFVPSLANPEPAVAEDQGAAHDAGVESTVLRPRVRGAHFLSYEGQEDGP